MRTAKPPPKVNPNSLSLSPTSNTHLGSPTTHVIPLARPSVPKTYNNINPTPLSAPASPPSAALAPRPPPPSYLLAPFGVSGTIAPTSQSEAHIRATTNVPPDVRGTLAMARSEASEIGGYHSLKRAQGAEGEGSPLAKAPPVGESWKEIASALNELRCSNLMKISSSATRFALLAAPLAAPLAATSLRLQRGLRREGRPPALPAPAGRRLGRHGHSRRQQRPQRLRSLRRRR